MDILFSDITVITMDDGNPVLKRGYVGVKGRKVAYVGESPPAEKASRVINGARRLLMPGLINAHTHMPMTLLRGYADDYKLQEWLFEHIFPAEEKLDAHCVMLGTQLALAECIRSGTISCTDMYFHTDKVAEAVDEAGMKANIDKPMFCLDMSQYDFEKQPFTHETRMTLAGYKNRDDGRIIINAGIHAEYTSGPQAWRDVVAFAHENDLRINLHLSETKTEHDDCVKKHGKTPTERFLEAGVFSRKVTAAHCVWLTDSDMKILAGHGASAAHCPTSNLKLSSGTARVTEMQKAGINVALGTDGVCSNNSHDMFEAIKTAALFQKYITNDPTSLPALEALKLATVNGALSQGRENETGKIAAGFDADLIMLNMDAPHLTPVYDPIASVVYSARGSDVCMTMVQGRTLYENGEYKTIDVERVTAEIEEYVLPRVLGV